MAQTNINVRMDAELKEQFSKLCDDLGFNVSTAVNIFAKAMVHYQGIPFEVSRKTPNAETLQAIEDAINGRNIYGSYSTVDEAMEALNAPD